MVIIAIMVTIVGYFIYICNYFVHFVFFVCIRDPEFFDDWEKHKTGDEVVTEKEKDKGKSLDEMKIINESLKDGFPKSNLECTNNLIWTDKHCFGK